MLATATTTRTARTTTTPRRWTAKRFRAVVAAVLAESLACGRARAALQDWGAQPNMIANLELQSARRTLKILAAAGLDSARYSALLQKYGAA